MINTKKPLFNKCPTPVHIKEIRERILPIVKPEIEKGKEVSIDAYELSRKLEKGPRAATLYWSLRGALWDENIVVEQRDKKVGQRIERKINFRAKKSSDTIPKPLDRC